MKTSSHLPFMTPMRFTIELGGEILEDVQHPATSGPLGTQHAVPGACADTEALQFLAERKAAGWRCGSGVGGVGAEWGIISVSAAQWNSGEGSF